jgi:hypothetical protein
MCLPTQARKRPSRTRGTTTNEPPETGQKQVVRLYREKITTEPRYVPASEKWYEIRKTRAAQALPAVPKWYDGPLETISKVVSLGAYRTNSFTKGPEWYDHLADRQGN